VALATVERLSFAYPDGAPALRDVSLALEAGEAVLVLGLSGSGKSTLLRALAGLVPHFHGGRFGGRVDVLGSDTRRARPAELAGRVATLFQDPEDQIVMARVEHEVAFGLENLGVPPGRIEGRVEEALASVGALELAGRATYELSSGELQRVCLAAALALRPQLLLLDEPTSQLDPEGAEAVIELASAQRLAVVVSEHRSERLLEAVDRVVFMDAGRILFDGAPDVARSWLGRERPAWVEQAVAPPALEPGGVVAALEDVSFAYGERAVVARADLELQRGEVVALRGPNGSGKTTLAKLAAGLLEPAAGRVLRRGRAAYLSQDPGRYLTRDRVDEEVALGVDGDLHRARRWLGELDLAGLDGRHPRDLSSGQRERVALASVLAVEPELLILDEPTRGIDPERKEQLVELLRTGAAERATLVVTHDEAFATAVADRTVVLGGRERARA
jgi:energy-coupling factor transport system ATP-binding protein